MKRLQLLALLSLSLFSMSSSCGKEDDAKPAALTLPLTVDFAGTAAAGKTSFTTNGLTISGAGTTSSSFVGGVLSCLASTNVAMHGTGKVTLAYSDSNCLIVDVSQLPTMQKITVKMFDNGRPSTQISLCDGTQVLGNSKSYTGTNPIVTYTLNVGGKTASKFYIYSSEADINSITFE